MSARPVRVLFDSEIFALQTHGGVSRYFVALLDHLPRHGVAPRLFAPLTFNHYLQTARTTGFTGVRAPISIRNRLTQKVERRLLAAADRVSSRLARFDLLHTTYYGRRLCVETPRVVTVYDMIPERLPLLFPEGNPHAGKRAACAAAALILAISDQSRRDLLALYPEIDCPIVVTPLAVDADAFRSRAHGHEDGTLLFVGRREGYKNFSTFADAASRLLSERPDLRVLCVGGGPLRSDELAPFATQGCAGRVTQRAATDLELPSLYRRATAFVFPSLYEGFGLPVLEAFACGCPVVLSNASCFPEVAGEAGEFFDPSSVEALLEALRRVTGDQARREELRRLGERRLTAFSWDRTAERTAVAYRRLLDVE